MIPNQAIAVGRRLLVVAVTLAGAAILTLTAPAGARPLEEPGPRVYRPPVDAPVVDPFRPPAQPWLAGNRGLEYATVPGTPVTAMGPGVVVFAGPVAGSLYVTILHPDGLRSSYSYLAAVRVSVGDRVLGGDLVGIAGSVFHLGVREGTTYLDPASLFGQLVGGGRVFLVPLGGRDGVGGAPLGPTGHGRYTRHPARDQVGRSPTSASARPRSPPRTFEAVFGPWLRRTVGRGEAHDAARRDHEAVARGRGPLRTPDPPLEPEDEAVHLR